MAAMKEITCKCGCGRNKLVRQADYNRGWGRYFSKSCKAKDQERKTHQYHKYITRKNTPEDHRNIPNDHPHSSDALGQWV